MLTDDELMERLDEMGPLYRSIKYLHERIESHIHNYGYGDMNRKDFLTATRIDLHSAIEQLDIVESHDEENREFMALAESID